MEKKPILHAMLWIMVYIVGVNFSDGFEAQTGIPNLVTALFLLALSVILIVHLKRNGWVERFGLKRMIKTDIKQVLYFIPLILLVLIQYVKGLNPSLTTKEIMICCLLMMGVGFVEELLFRGFLYQAIESRSGVKRAVLISGATFGIGHIVNLMRGYGYVEQIGQIIVAIAIGIALALLVALTRNIVPGIIFHILFNISGSVTNSEIRIDAMLVILIAVISLGYAFYLSKFLQHGINSKSLRDASVHKTVLPGT